ncbi:MAG TPA: peptide deformylase [Phycisphaerae bacterium]|nr:peptide deformylase [Phycisphaerae bacterium]
MKTHAPTTVGRPDPATLKLVLYPAAVLKKIAADVHQFDAWLLAVIERMKDLMVEHKGVGLAAPQVGLSQRIFLAAESAKREDIKVYINPVLTDEHGSEDGEEGCLSLPEIRIKVPRFTRLRVEALNEHGHAFSENLENYAARIIQHENDHLDGILLTDRMSPVAKLANRKKIKSLEDAAVKIRKR